MGIFIEKMSYGIMFVENMDDLFHDIKSIGIDIRSAKIKDKKCFCFKKDNITWLILRTKSPKFEEIYSRFKSVDNIINVNIYRVYFSNEKQTKELIDFMWSYGIWVTQEKRYELDIKIKKEL